MKGKILVFSIAIMFFMLAFSPITNSSLIQTGFENIQDDDINYLEAKNSLFSLILDIVNEPEIQEFFNNVFENMDFSDVFDSDIELNEINNKIRTKNPRLYYSLIFSRSSFTKDYLEKSYKQGIEIINLIGEEDSKKIIKTLNPLNKNEYNDLNKIIFSEEKYKDRIEKLKELNINLKKDEPLEDWPIICSILFAIATPWIFHMRFMAVTCILLFREGGILYEIWGLRVALNMLAYAATMEQILRYFDCITP